MGSRCSRSEPDLQSIQFENARKATSYCYQLDQSRRSLSLPGQPTASRPVPQRVTIQSAPSRSRCQIVLGIYLKVTESTMCSNERQMWQLVDTRLRSVVTKFASLCAFKWRNAARSSRTHGITRHQAEHLLTALAQRGFTLLALDFDLTMIDCHTGGDWQGSPADLVRRVRPVFVALLKAAALGSSGMRIAIVTFGAQADMIRAVLSIIVGTVKAAQFVIIANDGSWDQAAAMVEASRNLALDGESVHWLSQPHERYGAKMPFLCAAWAAVGWEAGPGQTLLVDDDPINISVAVQCGVPAVHFDCEGLSPELRILAAIEAVGRTRRLLFVEVDGVLNNGLSTTESTICPQMVSNLSWLVRHCSAHLVITSAWRLDSIKYALLEESLNRAGLCILSVTPDMQQMGDLSTCKALEIRTEIDTLQLSHDSVWLALDASDLTSSDPFMDEKCFVHVDHTVGLVNSKVIESAHKLLVRAAAHADRAVEAGRVASIAAHRRMAARVASI